MGMEIQAGCEQSSPNPDFISPDGFDLCVECLTVTPYKTEVPIDTRLYYVEGMGQHCAECYLGGRPNEEVVSPEV